MVKNKQHFEPQEPEPKIDPRMAIFFRLIGAILSLAVIAIGWEYVLLNIGALLGMASVYNGTQKPKEINLDSVVMGIFTILTTGFVRAAIYVDGVIFTTFMLGMAILSFIGLAKTTQKEKKTGEKRDQPINDAF